MPRSVYDHNMSVRADQLGRLGEDEKGTHSVSTPGGEQGLGIAFVARQP